jgi:hypothetical protein
MNKTKLVLFAALLLCTAAVLADEQRPSTLPKTDADVLAAPRPTSVSSTEAGTQQQLPARFEPGLQAIEDNYGAQMQRLRAQIAAATSMETQDALQQQVLSLKKEWMLASATRRLELAREHNDTEAAAEIERAIENIRRNVTGGAQ